MRPSLICGKNTHLVVHSSSSSERSLRAALCFSSKRSFSLLAASIKYKKQLIKQAEGWKRFSLSRLFLPMSPFSIALMSGLSLQSVGGRNLSMPGSSSFSVIAKLVKLYIYPGSKKANKATALWTLNISVHFILLHHTTTQHNATRKSFIRGSAGSARQTTERCDVCMHLCPNLKALKQRQRTAMFGGWKADLGRVGRPWRYPPQ